MKKLFLCFLFVSLSSAFAQANSGVFGYLGGSYLGGSSFMGIGNFGGYGNYNGYGNLGAFGNFGGLYSGSSYGGNFGGNIVGYRPYPVLTPRLTYQLNYRYMPIYGNGGFYPGSNYGWNPYMNRGYSPYYNRGMQWYQPGYVPRSRGSSYSYSGRDYSYRDNQDRDRPTPRRDSKPEPTQRPSEPDPAPTAAPAPGPTPNICGYQLVKKRFHNLKNGKKFGEKECKELQKQSEIIDSKFTPQVGSHLKQQCIYLKAVHEIRGQCNRVLECKPKSEHVKEIKSKEACEAQDYKWQGLLGFRKCMAPMILDIKRNRCSRLPPKLPLGCHYEGEGDDRVEICPVEIKPPLQGTVEPPPSIENPKPVETKPICIDPTNHPITGEVNYCGPGMKVDKGGCCVYTDEELPLPIPVEPNTDTEGEAPCIKCQTSGDAPKTICDSLGIKCDECEKGQAKYKSINTIELLKKPIFPETREEKNNAKCIYRYMKNSGAVKTFTSCNGVDGAYCANSDYLYDVYKGFEDVTKCFGMSKDDKLLFLSLLGHESRFQMNAKNNNDPSTGLAQIVIGEHMSIPGLSKYKKDFPFVTGKIQGDQCKANYSKYYDKVEGLGKLSKSFVRLPKQKKNESNKDYKERISKQEAAIDKKVCDSGMASDPNIGLNMAAAEFSSKREEIKKILSGDLRCYTVGRVDAKNKTFSMNLDKKSKEYHKLESRLTAMAYNQGSANVRASLCSYMASKKSVKGASGKFVVSKERSNRKKGESKYINDIVFEYDVSKTVDMKNKMSLSHFKIDSSMMKSIINGERPNKKGFWALEDAKYTHDSKKKYEQNYYFKILKDASNMSKASKADKEKLECSPDL